MILQCAFLFVLLHGAAEHIMLEYVLDAIAVVESGGDPNAIGDGGEALGVLQIHRDYWTDGTRLLGVDWPHQDAFDPVKARCVARAYLSRYQQGYPTTPETWARIHNGGPCGMKKHCTKPYYERVRSHLPK